MNAIRLTAIVPIVAGALGPVFGGFSCTRDTTVAKVGPIELNAKRREDVNMPPWAGIGAIVVVGVPLVMGRRG